MNIEDMRTRILSTKKGRRVAYEGQWDIHFNVALEIERARMNAGLSQKKLAKKMKTFQSNIARMENGRAGVSFSLLNRFARAIGKKVVLSFEDPNMENPYR